MTQLEKALDFAKEKHKGQKYGSKPYMEHIYKTLDVAIKLDFRANIKVACALHDTLEDTNTSFQELEKEFGNEVAEIVYSVTDELGRNRKERKLKTYQKIKHNWQGLMVKICDRIANIESSQKDSPEKLEMYLSEHNLFYKELYTKHHSYTIKKGWDLLIKTVEDARG